jgi:hypothetical protein
MGWGTARLLVRLVRDRATLHSVYALPERI